jgi:hypothetical protein
MAELVEWLLAEGRVAAIAMVILAAELLAALWLGRRGRAAFAANALSGLGLLGALFASLASWGGIAILAFLSAGLGAHLVYLALLRRGA